MSLWKENGRVKQLYQLGRLSRGRHRLRALTNHAQPTYYTLHAVFVIDIAFIYTKLIYGFDIAYTRYRCSIIEWVQLS